jgi:glycosyltransferase involved in cell wall biosynthesis
VAALLEADSEHEFLLFIDAQSADEIDLPDGAQPVIMPTEESPTESASASSRRSFGDLRAMSLSVRRESLDVFFFPSVYSFFPLLFRPRVILGIHDVIAEDYPTAIFPSLWRRWLWSFKSRVARHQADYLLAVSEFAREGILRHFEHPPEKVCVVEEAAASCFRRLSEDEKDSALISRFGLRGRSPVLLYLGGINPHKNLDALLRSVAELRREEQFKALELVIVSDITGDNFTPGLDRARDLISELNLDRSVKFTGFLPDEETAQLLNLADALVLPSLAEGFGLPAVEAAACGTPVVATTNSPLPQLLEGGGLFVDPAQPEELTAALTRLLSEPELHRQMSQTALERASMLSWQRSASQFMDLLEAIEREG